ncbi:MAG TPA: hypothetical protein VF756_10045 [Thermoanaerobaculia bacterium]
MRALLRFHIHVGARLAMRALVPVIAAAVAGFMLLGDDFLVSFSNLLYGSGFTGGSAILIALGCLGFAASAAPRVCRGLHGWLRHLPISGKSHRRAAMLAIAVAETPVLTGFLFLSLAASRIGAASWVDALGLMVCAPAAALTVMPVERRLLARPLGLASAVVAVSGGWLLVVAGAVLLMAADAGAGSLPHGPLGAPALARSRERGSVGGSVELLIAWRALRWRLLSAAAAGLLPLGAAAAFVANNELAPQHVRLAALLGGSCGVTFLFADLGEVLGARRPAWPWSRSLPWSARRRVLFDVGFLAAHALPVILLTARIDALSSLAVLALTPLLAARAAGAMRRAPERRTGASGEIFLEGLLLSAATALLPWVSLPALLATPWAVRAAAERDRRQKVSRWLELHHLAVGDPQSWSAG